MTTKAKKADAVEVLAQSMLSLLRSRRNVGGDAYPPTLRALAEAAGASADSPAVLKAVGKKSFTAEATVTEKIGRTPSLDSPVYFTRDIPPKPALAQRLVLVLESQKRLGAEAYPPTLARLAELCDNPANTALTKAVGQQAMTDVAVVVGKPLLNAPVVFKSDLDGDQTTILPALLRYALLSLSSGHSDSAETLAFTVTEINKKFHKDLQTRISEALGQPEMRQALPSEFSWVLNNKKPLFFLSRIKPRESDPAEKVVPMTAPMDDEPLDVPTRPKLAFAEAFREAFRKIDRQNGATNFVKLVDLRGAMGWADRNEFDAGLRALRLLGEFSLNSHEGLHGTLTTEEREAGLRESGSLLIYVSRG